MLGRMWLASLLMLLLSMPCAAQTIVDDMDAAVTVNFAAYNNFQTSATSIAAVTGWTNAPDDTALQPQGLSSQGSVVYTVGGVQTVQADIYTKFSTYGAVYPGGKNYLRVDAAYAGPTYQVRYCPTDKLFFATIGGQTMRLEYDRRSAALNFVPAQHPHSAIECYGVNFYASKDGFSYQQLSTNLVGVVFGKGGGDASISRESFSATVPAGSQYIKVSVRCISTVPSSTGEIINLAGGYADIMLARVSLEGAALQLPSQPPGPSSSSSSNEEGTPINPASSGPEQTTGSSHPNQSNSESSSSKNSAGGKGSASSSSSKGSSGSSRGNTGNKLSPGQDKESVDSTPNLTPNDPRVNVNRTQNFEIPFSGTSLLYIGATIFVIFMLGYKAWRR